jgi:hypothetical protein
MTSRTTRLIYGAVIGAVLIGAVLMLVPPRNTVVLTENGFHPRILTITRRGDRAVCE